MAKFYHMQGTAIKIPFLLKKGSAYRLFCSFQDSGRRSMMRSLSRNSKLRHLLYSFIIFFSLFGLCYFISIYLGKVEFFYVLLNRIPFFLMGHALSMLCLKLGLPKAIASFARALLTAEGASSIGNMVMPSGSDSGANFDKEVTSPSSGNWRQYLNLSEEEGDSAPEPSTSSTWSGSWIEKWLFPEGSSSAPNPALPEVGRGFIFEQINSRLLLAAGKKSGWQPPIDKIQTLISLKEQVIFRMAELDPHPFWMGEQNRNRLIADSILTKNNWEYNPETLSKRLSQLNERGINCSFYHDLKKLREDGGP